MKTNKKNESGATSTIASLPKEIKDRIVVVGTGNPFSGTINHTNVNSDISPFNRNPLTKEQISPKPNTTIPSALRKKVKEDISIQVNYGENSPSIKKQLTAQGFKFNKELIKGCEAIRIDLLALADIDILTKKQVLKAFAKLNTVISENVIQTTFGKDVKSVLKSTIANGKQI